MEERNTLGERKIENFLLKSEKGMSITGNTTRRTDFTGGELEQ